MCATRGFHSGKALSSAIFLIGLAVLFATDTFWPGILVLIALSGVVKALTRSQAGDQGDPEMSLAGAQGLSLAGPAQDPAARPLIYPANCPNCGASAPETAQDARAGQKVVCEYCGATLQPITGQATAP